MIQPYYSDKWVTIYHGDCREILPELPDKSVDLVLTDPPYNLGKRYGAKSNDSRDPKEYWQWYREIFALVDQCFGEGYLYVSQSDKGIFGAKPIFESLGLEYIQTLIWWGRNGYSMQLHRKSWSYRHEPILFMQKGNPPPLIAGQPGQWYTSVIEVPRPQSNFREGRYHPTQKPVGLYSIIIARTPSHIMLDNFAGVGSSLVAAKKLCCKSIGIEIEEKYCEIAARRCSQEVMELKVSRNKQGAL